jgi:hypothetical protein
MHKSSILNNKEDDKWSFLEFLSPMPMFLFCTILVFGEPPKPNPSQNQVA